MIAVLSAHYLHSAWCLKESLTNLAGDAAGDNNRLIPVRIVECKPDGLLKTRTYIDLLGLAEDRAKAELLTKIKGTRLKPRQAPAFPAGVVVPGYPGNIPAV